MFLKWQYKIVLGYSFQLWNRTVVRDLFLIFGAVTVSFVLETIVCFKHNLRWKQLAIVERNVSDVQCVYWQWLGNVHPPCIDLRKSFRHYLNSITFLTEFSSCWGKRGALSTAYYASFVVHQSQQVVKTSFGCCSFHLLTPAFSKVQLPWQF